MCKVSKEKQVQDQDSCLNNRVLFHKDYQT